MEVLKEEPITITEAREIMKSVAKERELKPRQKMCVEYLNKVPKLSMSKVEKLKKALLETKLLKPEKVVELINALPTIPEEVGVILEKEKLKRSEIEQIAELLKKEIEGK